MSDIGADVLAEWRVVPEDVASLPVFAFWYGGAALSNEALSDERDESRLLIFSVLHCSIRRSTAR